MENEENIKVRKIHKIKRPLPPESTPESIGVPTKVNNDFQLQNRDASAVEKPQQTDSSENIHFITEEELIAPSPESIKSLLQNKTILMMLAVAALCGAVIASVLFPSSGSVKSIGKGLEGVVNNPDVPAGRSRCGLVEPHQGCVLYIMNPRNQEVTAKDFFTTAAKWTNRERYIIEVGNMKYGNVRIKPGYIAQINIPPLSY